MNFAERLRSRSKRTSAFRSCWRERKGRILPALPSCGRRRWNSPPAAREFHDPAVARHPPQRWVIDLNGRCARTFVSLSFRDGPGPG